MSAYAVRCRVNIKVTNSGQTVMQREFVLNDITDALDMLEDEGGG